MINQHSDQFHRNSAFRKTDMQSTDFTNSDIHLGATNQMMNVINAQNMLIMKLLERQNMLFQQLNKKSTSQESGSGSNIAQPKNNRPETEYFNNQRSSPGENNQFDPPKRQKYRNHSKTNSFQTYKYQRDNSASQEENDMSENKHEKNQEKKKQSETKNMVKNFSKAIFNFIKKNHGKMIRVLNHLNISEEEFLKTYQAYKGRIHSISELRSLWTTQGNPYNKAFRMLSYEYLQKHCLAKTFNSRIENYSIHLKYRERLLDGIKHPYEFTLLKTS